MFDSERGLLIPDWPAPNNVHALVTTRNSFQTANSADTFSGYAAFNLALHVHDRPEKVLANRAILAKQLAIPESQFFWLEQVHGTRVISTESTTNETQQPPRADAIISQSKHHVCTIMTADCLPVLFCDLSSNGKATQVAAAHAGWRGLADGILTKTLETFTQPKNVIAWLGPAISQIHFEVGQDVYDAFILKDPENADAFIESKNSSIVQPKWRANLVQLARRELSKAGIKAVYGGQACTYENVSRFYSYRRDGNQSGRFASLIYLS